jgi:acetyl-CoA C-acetyltransferase
MAQTSSPLPPIYIVSAARTPIGAFQGSLSSLRAPELGATAIKGALSRAKLAPEVIQEVFMGNVLSAGIGQAPARQAAIFAGIPNTVPATTVSKVCGSGLQAVIFGAKTLAVGDADVVLVGGMESMSNVPYYLDKARTGYRMGDGKIVDGMIFDGLWDPYSNVHMGTCGDKCAAEYKFTREQQDDFSKESFRRALAAQKEGMFDAEIEAVSVPQRKGDPLLVKQDEGPSKGDPTKFASLKPAFSKDGTITAANASSINDGASALILATEKAVKEHKLRRRGAGARVVHHRAGQGHRRYGREVGPEEGPDRPLRDQRGVRGRNPGRQQAVGARPAEGQRPRRRGRPGAPHRRHRRAPAHHARARDEGPQRQARPGEPVHRRRRGPRARRRAVAQDG